MRLLVPSLALLLLAAPLASAGFGEGALLFEELVVEGAENVGEPTIGIPWNTDSLFFHAGATTIKGVFADDDSVTWTDVTPPYQLPINLDPMLVADEDTGRVLAGGLLGPCSLMYYSDDDGVTWLPAGNMCSGAQFDHQSIGIGPKPGVGNPTNSPQLQNAYYCGQLGLIGCSVSFDGGVTWTAPTPAVVQFVDPGGDDTAACGGFHGHWRISRVTGTAMLPVPACASRHGLLVANAGLDGTEVAGVTGLLFEGRTVAGSHEWDGGFDSSIGISRGEGWIYYGQADYMGARIGLSKDEGLSWESLGEGADTTTWLDVGQFHDPPVVAATFADVQAGDDDRAAFTFLGLEDLDGDGAGDEYGDLYACDEPADGENRYWNYYAAFTYDAGNTWEVQRLTDHPVQVGGIWDGGGGNPCRNLLDFNDMDIDSEGRVHIGYADGCIAECWKVEGGGDDRYAVEPRVLRQVAGNGLFAAFDEAPPGGASQPEPSEPLEDGDDGEESPAPGLLLVAVGLVAAAFVARRRV
ncbi:MAG: sialidase family protein [Thermoplasmatota archaeon]